MVYRYATYEKRDLKPLVYGPPGHAVGLLDEIRPAREIVPDMVRGAEEVIAALFSAAPAASGGRSGG